MAAAAPKDAPSRPADKDCKWEKLSDANVGLDAWVERCNYGPRRTDFIFQGRSLAIRESDVGGGKPDPLVDVLDLLPGETIEAGLKRIFNSKTDPKIAKRCVLAPYKGEGERVPAGVKRFTFVPDARYQKELDKKASDGIPDPACGDWGDQPDGIQYFETQPKSGATRVLFVRVGQDVPLFDENTLKILPAKK